jgi:hypothetical protein
VQRPFHGLLLGSASIMIAAIAACGTPAPDVPSPPSSLPMTSVPVTSAPVSAPPSTLDSRPAALGSMPDVVGQRLSDAEQILREAGFLSVQSVDASGAGRHILDKNNWVVQRQDPPAGSTPAAGAAITLGATKPTDNLATPTSVSGVVPAVICRDLQTAQDAMRAAGFYVLVPKDGLGKGRPALIDRDWIVVGQSAAAGSSPKRTTVIRLTVVKYGEPTGNSGCRS